MIHDFSLLYLEPKSSRFGSLWNTRLSYTESGFGCQKIKMGAPREIKIHLYVTSVVEITLQRML